MTHGYVLTWKKWCKHTPKSHANVKCAAQMHRFLLVRGKAQPRWLSLPEPFEMGIVIRIAICQLWHVDEVYSEAGGDLLVATSQWNNDKLYPVLIPTIKHKMNKAVVGNKRFFEATCCEPQTWYMCIPAPHKQRLHRTATCSSSCVPKSNVCILHIMMHPERVLENASPRCVGCAPGCMGHAGTTTLTQMALA
eukprot:360454-Chlamydomonas_euryale.AAC.6